MIRTASRRTCQLHTRALAALFSDTSRTYSTTLTRPFASPNNRVQHELPPNLRIDPRSSFAPIDEEASEPLDDILEDVAADEYDGYDEDEEYPELMVADEPQYAVPLPERLSVTIHTLFNAQDNVAGSIILNENVFGRDPIRADLLKRSVDYYRAKKRGRRKAVTKTIGQVSGSGRKLRPQKGQGSARIGHSRAAHHRGGAKAHGPKNVTDYGNTKLNKKVRRLAVSHALSQKLLEGNLILLNHLYELPTHKTGDLIRRIEPLWGDASALVLDAYYPEENGDDETRQQDFPATSYQGVPLNLFVAAGNLHQMTVGNEHAANVHDIIKHEKLVLTLAALEKLEARLGDL